MGKTVVGKGMKNVAKWVPKWSQNCVRNRYRIGKYHEQCMPKSTQKNIIFQKVPKIGKNTPRCDFERKRAERVAPEWSIFGSHGPQGAAPSTRTC